MSTEYRVDRADRKVVPCGMCSIIYLGGNAAQARRTLREAALGFDAWGKPNPAYGAIMSKWDNQRREYVIQDQRGINQGKTK